jgi:phage shock protein PspC (stress-responsive transcriptional regulator)
MSSNSSKKLVQLTFVVVAFYIVISIVLYVCLEAVEDDAIVTATTSVVAAGFPSAKKDVGGKKKFEMVPVTTERFNRKSYSSGSSVRSEFEKRYPPDDVDRVRAAVEALRVKAPDTQPNMPYDIYNCPETPPAGYPMTWKLSRQILKDWNPKDTEIPTRVYHGLCVFEWDRDMSKAEAYRAAEVPFVVQNSPEVLWASERWNSPGYLQKMVGKEPQRTEHSSTAHLMYWKSLPKDRVPPGWVPPSENVEMTIDKFMEHATEMELHKTDQLNREHWYFRLNGVDKGKNSYLYDELPIFLPGEEPTFYMIDPDEARGINCRFGMRGTHVRLRFIVSFYDSQGLPHFRLVASCYPFVGNMAIAHYDSSLK